MLDLSQLYRKGYNFMVFFGLLKVSFKRVSGLSDEMKTEAFREGGNNNVVYSLSQPRSEERVITLERGLFAIESEFSLYKPGYRFYDDVSIFVIGEGGLFITSYFLTGCRIRKVSINDLDAENSSLVMATIELTYEKLEEV